MSIRFRSLSVLLSTVFFVSCFSQKEVTTTTKQEQTDAKTLTNQVIWYSNEFPTEYVSGVRSMKDGKHFTSLDFENGEMVVNKYTYTSYEKLGALVKSSELKDENGKSLSIDDYTFSADESKLLLATSQESIYRHSSKSFYYIYDLNTKKTTPLTDNSKGKQRLAEFSPNGLMVAFVRNNNLFMKNLETNVEHQVTVDGKMNQIINGAVDWVYEEEFSFHKGFHWSPNGRRIAYYKFDESKVKEFQITYYNDLYPDHYKFKYPKAGEDNSIVSVHVFNVNSLTSNDVILSGETDIYIPRMKWSKNPEVLFITQLNRLQNQLDLYKVNCNPKDPKQTKLIGKVIYIEKSKTYIDIHDNLTFLENGSFLWTSEKSGYNHIYLISENGDKGDQLTKGEWEVTELLGVDEKRKKIYFISAEDGPTQRQLYSIDLDGKNKKKLSTKKGFNEATYSTTFDYYINYHSDANTPYYITLHKNDGSLVKVLKDNKALVEKTKEYGFQPKEFFSFTTSEGIKLNGWKILPPNFDASKKYPVLMTCYNGPGINLVNDSWGGRNLMWHQLLAQKGYIVVCVDGRGTGYRGRDFKHVTYLQLGKYETMDQIETAKYLGGLPYVDASRIGIQGWSYGGYMASLCMTKGADYFKAGIAVAPVTNWRYYDNVYTERFMRTPQENGESYDKNSPINHVSKLKGKYLLVHGGGDDNVHPQNSMEMINALVKANKEFEMFYYPNKNHGIYGGTTRMHLFNKMTKFLEENL